MRFLIIYDITLIVYKFFYYLGFSKSSLDII
jgi:hypothetical protein